MGPPLFSDGDDPQRTKKRKRLAGFNGAAALQRRRRTSKPPLPSWTPVLQWGRRSSATETDASPEHIASACLASMGPPLFSDGDIRTAKDCCRMLSASMGPPLFSDGDVGRDSGTSIQSAVLQWGRRSSATETWLSQSPSQLPQTCFNGAAALQRRRLELISGGKT